MIKQFLPFERLGLSIRQKHLPLQVKGGVSILTYPSQLLFSHLLQIIIALLSLFYLSACSPTYQRKWELQENITLTSKFNSGRLILPPDTDSSNLELDITRSYSGTRFYVNLLSLQAPPLKEDPSRTRLEIKFEADEEPWIVYPFLFRGGQRLLFPAEVAEALIDALFQGRTFTITIGRSTLLAIPDQFCEEYAKLISLSI
jgi:hypothetical protein